VSPFLTLVHRDLALSLRQAADALVAVMFAVLVVVLFAFGIGPEQEVLARVSAGVVWVAALLAAMLSLDRLFQADHDDGALEQLALGPLPLWSVALAKAASHWLVTGLPLIVAAPALALMMAMPASGLIALIAAMLLGTPCLSLLGAIGAALVLGARRGGVLVAFLVLPLAIPVLIFGAAATEAALTAQDPVPHLMLIGACLLASLALAPIAAAAALRQAVG
jgi:heme exporter protein B